MKELQRLERSLSFLCALHLALMTLCLAFFVALIFPGSDPLICLLWAFGTVIPVQLIHQLCLRIPNQLPRLLCCGLVTLLAVLIPDNSLRRFYYGLCCVPILIAGLWLNRPCGRIVLTVPKIYHLLICLLLYAFGKIIRSPIMSGMAIALAALMTLCLCFYRNQEKVLRALRDDAKEEVAQRNIIRLNHRVMGMFAILGVLILAAVPWLLRWQSTRTAPIEKPLETGTYSMTEAVSTSLEYVTLPPNIRPTEAGELLNYDKFGNIMMWIFVGVIGCAVLLVIAAVVIDLINIQEGNPKHSNQERQQSWQMERLEQKILSEAQEESAVGWEKKLRRRYEKLIRSRVQKGRKLSALTPAELEAEAKLAGPGAETVHKLYEQTRYSQSPADRERYTAFKEAISALEAPASRKPEEKT